MLGLIYAFLFITVWLSRKGLLRCYTISTETMTDWLDAAHRFLDLDNLRYDDVDADVKRSGATLRSAEPQRQAVLVGTDHNLGGHVGEAQELPGAQSSRNRSCSAFYAASPATATATAATATAANSTTNEALHGRRNTSLRPTPCAMLPTPAPLPPPSTLPATPRSISRFYHWT